MQTFRSLFPWLGLLTNWKKSLTVPTPGMTLFRKSWIWCWGKFLPKDRSYDLHSCRTLTGGFMSVSDILLSGGARWPPLSVAEHETSPVLVGKILCPQHKLQYLCCWCRPEKSFTLSLKGQSLRGLIFSSFSFLGNDSFRYLQSQFGCSLSRPLKYLRSEIAYQWIKA